MARKPKPKPRNPVARSLWDGSCKPRVIPNRRREGKRVKQQLDREMKQEWKAEG